MANTSISIANRKRKRVVLNMLQLALEVATQRIRVAQAGRGSGKSTGAALDMKNILYDMPRSKNFLFCETYQQALTRTLPSTIKALDMIGFKKDLHYFIGRMPPKSWKWDMPYEAPQVPNRTIFFMNGTAWDMLSQESNSRGGNYSSGLADEAQDLDRGKFESQAIPTLRGERERFKHRKTFRRISLYCSMPRIRRAEWIFLYEELAQSSPEEYLYLSAPSKINIKNLGPEWFKDQKRIMMKSEYDIEIGNVRPKKVIGGFYPHFNDIAHTYVRFNNDYLDGLIDNANGYSEDSFDNMSCLQDGDLNFNDVLDISMDYGAWFNGIVTGQDGDHNEYRMLSAMSINESDRFEDLLNKWCAYYRFHKVKTVNYWYDHTALDRDARAETYPEIVKRVLSSHGWMVNDQYIGQQPSQDDRYRFMGYLYRGDRPELPQVSMNRHHCKYLVISLNGADVRQGRNGFEKEKKDEKNRSIDQRTTTHFSDAHDTLLMGKFAERTIQGGASYIPGFIYKTS